MTRHSVQPGTDQGQSPLRMIDGIVVYARKDNSGRPSIVDAIDQDERKIGFIADQLWRRGFGVMRQKSHRAGKVFYLFKAKWARPGSPPEDPFEGTN